MLAKIEMLRGLRKPESPGDHLILAQHHYAQHDYGASLREYRVALSDDSLRRAPDRFALYNAACTACLLASEVQDEDERESLLANALAWLREEQGLRVARLAKIEAAGTPEEAQHARARFEQHVRHASLKDPDLELLRGTGALDEVYPPSASANTDATPGE